MRFCGKPLEIRARVSRVFRGFRTKRIRKEGKGRAGSNNFRDPVSLYALITALPLLTHANTLLEFVRAN